MFDQLEDDLGELGPLVRDELIAGLHAEEVMARQTMRAIEEANERIGAAAIEGIGQKMMSMDANLYFWWAIREPGCWQDKGFRREILRDNPEVRPRYVPRKTTLRVNGLRDTRKRTQPKGRKLRGVGW